MLAKRIVPCLDIKDGKVVKGVKFKELKIIDDPVTLAKYYSKALADELVFYDITASNEQRETIFDIAKQVAQEINIPFTIGGGIKSIEDFDRALKSGADKVSINSAAVENPSLITEASKKYGAQCVVLSIDAKKVDGQWKVFIQGGRKNTQLDVVTWAMIGEKLGAGEIVLNSIDTDGVKEGYSHEILAAIVDQVKIPVIASGGAGTKDHFLEVFKESKVDAALAASVFHNETIKIKELKAYLKDHGIEMRL
jgi:cyclase